MDEQVKVHEFFLGLQWDTLAALCEYKLTPLGCVPGLRVSRVGGFHSICGSWASSLNSLGHELFEAPSYGFQNASTPSNSLWR